MQFAFAAMDLIEVPHVVEHVARFLPSVRQSGMPFGIIINLIIPGNPLLGVVATFATEQVSCQPYQPNLLSLSHQATLLNPLQPDLVCSLQHSIPHRLENPKRFVYVLCTVLVVLHCHVCFAAVLSNCVSCITPPIPTNGSTVTCLCMHVIGHEDDQMSVIVKILTWLP
jgi:hypothetical protein